MATVRSAATTTGWRSRCARSAGRCTPSTRSNARSTGSPRSASTAASRSRARRRGGRAVLLLRALRPLGRRRGPGDRRHGRRPPWLSRYARGSRTPTRSGWRRSPTSTPAPSTTCCACAPTCSWSSRVRRTRYGRSRPRAGDPAHLGRPRRHAGRLSAGARRGRRRQRIGRVVVAKSARGDGVAGRLMDEALAVVGARPVGARRADPAGGLLPRYGYAVSGPEFVEDGIPHVPMSRPALA